jgi:hypothetical protein
VERLSGEMPWGDDVGFADIRGLRVRFDILPFAEAARRRCALLEVAPEI